MKYQSTRGFSEKKTASEAVVLGIADDGGLFIPERIPELSQSLEELCKLDYQETAYQIMSLFFPEFEKGAFRQAVQKAYQSKFDSHGIAPVIKAGKLNFMELYHGPTLAFKDLALSFLPELMKLSLEQEKINDKVVILTATSGDTGKAALEGFKNKEGIQIIVFYPQDGVSEMQKLQMVTEDGENVFVAAVEGNFDDAQSGVKAIFNDKNFQAELSQKGIRLSSANSINIGRLIPQIVYYVYGYCQMVNQGEIAIGEKINVVVPTGNFGNILAAYYAKKMGVPIDKLICASNENKVLFDFFRTSTYDRNRSLVMTTSPSMDILISSNLERLLFEISDRNSQKISELMIELEKKGKYSIDEKMAKNLSDFYGTFADEEEVQQAIADVFRESNYLIDTHTAVAVHGYRKYKEETKDETPALIVSTASPFKFSGSVGEALGISKNGENFYQEAQEIADFANVGIPFQLKKLIEMPIRFTQIFSKREMKKVVSEFLRL